MQIWKILAFLGAVLFLSDTIYAQQWTSDSHSEYKRDTLPFSQRFIHRLGVEGRAGYIFQTSPFLEYSNHQYKAMKNAYAGHLKYSFQLRPHTVADQAYIGAYQGIGVGYFNFGNPEELGNPLAVYLFQGGRIAQFSPRISLNYEWNFGASFGWKPYDEYDNPENQIIGSKVNAYLNVNLYLKWALSPKFDLMIGATGSHFSNGNTQYPNSGLNTVDCKVGLVYNFNRRADELAQSWQRPIVPPFPRHVSYDLTLFGSWRKKAVAHEGSSGQVPAPGTYNVFGFSFAPMYNFGYKFRAGVALDGVYDHSANMKESYEEENGFYTPPAKKQMALGLSARGEFVMPYFTVGRIAQFSPRISLNYEWNFGASFGWKPYDEYDNPENQIIGSKVNAYLNVNLYLKWALSPKFDLMIGATGSHFSNGNTQYPNSGLNTVDCKVGLVYNFNRRADELAQSWQRPIVPPFPRHVSYDLTLFGSWRKKAVAHEGSSGQVPAPGTYNVFGFSFAPMYNFGYKFRAGVALDGVYDHSANMKESYEEENGFYTPPAKKQMALGLSARGEFVMPYFTVGIGLGANVLHGGGDMKSFYQILALKIDVTRNSYLHIGYNLREFHEPNYLMLGIGYRFNNKRPKLF